VTTKFVKCCYFVNNDYYIVRFIFYPDFNLVMNSIRILINNEILLNFRLIYWVEEFKYLRTTLTNQNSIPEEIKSRLRSRNACYHSVQNLLSSRLLSKNLKIKKYRTIILPVFCMSVKLGR